ncbi:hypothetical protein NC99_05400 [Sunxiuqinia dokdonensis]|uniref:Uncharacterized protein n=1 Tax=Sunxiuqinia dokdonensis TaxID=1409788 RepID=A0A0L8VE08_9BACT|nr:hypothetical protein NC99_05400 [Sunxiuqinia dokdonensis]
MTKRQLKSPKALHIQKGRFFSLKKVWGLIFFIFLQRL